MCFAGALSLWHAVPAAHDAVNGGVKQAAWAFCIVGSTAAARLTNACPPSMGECLPLVPTMLSRMWQRASLSHPQLLRSACLLASSHRCCQLVCSLQLPASRLVLVAVANSLDLTERRLPELHARGCPPQLLQFPAYSRGQILSILQQRLDTLPGPVFATKALEFCARKVGTGG